MELKQIVDNLFSTWNPLFQRQKADANRLNGKFMTIHVTRPDANGVEHEIPNSVLVKLNDLPDFAWRVETMLNQAVEQLIVTSQNKRFDTEYVERFIKAAFTEADALMPDKDLWPLNPFLDQQATRRGRTCAVVLWHLSKEGLLVPDTTPWDTGFVVSTQNVKAYKIWRTRDQIEQDIERYRQVNIGVPKEAQIQISDLPGSSDAQGSHDIEITNIWGEDVNELWAGSALIYRQKNPFDLLPVIYHKVPMGSMLLDKDTLQYQGESIAFLVRDLVDEMVRLASLEESMNLKAYDRALQQFLPADQVATTKAAEYEKVTEPGSNTKVVIGGGFQEIPMTEIMRHADSLSGKMQARIDRAMATVIQNQLQPKTATEILGATKEREDIIFPRVAMRGLTKQDIARIGIKQTLAACKKAGISQFKMGEETWDVDKLRGEYKIEFKYAFKDPQTDVARQAVAVGYRGIRPDGWILRNIILSDDPEGEERLLKSEKAGRMSPAVDLDRTITALIEEADNGREGAEDEAIELIPQWISAIQQAMGGEMTPANPDEVKPSAPLIPAIKGT